MHLTLRAAKPDQLWMLMNRVAPPDWQITAALPLIAPSRSAGADDALGVLDALLSQEAVG
ncbi:hypothetical protein [Nonomuraea sp. LPB2021202275-12-8]|uniref:hypothetical protein n=1 Tax=Nonomuraea sp. LPB2021202275-12-8 TaxID=3120159 RepID=UPI00300C0384